jgi:hypothetical protein
MSGMANSKQKVNLMAMIFCTIDFFSRLLQRLLDARLLGKGKGVGGRLPMLVSVGVASEKSLQTDSSRAYHELLTEQPPRSDLTVDERACKLDQSKSVWWWCVMLLIHECQNVVAFTPDSQSRCDTTFINWSKESSRLMFRLHVMAPHSACRDCVLSCCMCLAYTKRHV